MSELTRRVAGLALAAAGGALAVAAASRYVAPYRPQLEHVAVPAPAGHDGLAGLRIGFVTDTHIGPFISLANLDHGLALLEREHPDLLLLGGDFASESPRFVESAVARLAGAARRAPLGTLAVLGNHDFTAGPIRVATALQKHGIPVLRNEARCIRRCGADLWIVGLDETLLGRADPDRAFASVPAGAAALALWHEPDGAEACAGRGAFLQLSGHSHGGQVRVPLLGPLAAPPGGRRYVAGSYRVGRMTVYTSRGLGTYRPPVRFRCPPEITLITLTAPSSE